MTNFAGPRRVFLLAAGIFIMLLGAWAGLIRAGWLLPTLLPTLPAGHGPLMVSGFLGTLVGLERAVALRKPWAYAAPLLTVAGSVAGLLGLPAWVPALLITAGSAVVTWLFVLIHRLQPELFNRMLLSGAAAWAAGNLLWLTGRGVSEVVLWWLAFIIYTIAAERLELTRILKPGPASRRAFIAASALLAAGPLTALINQPLGWRLAGAGMIALAAWLLINDIARRTIRHGGLTRYIAICLLSGHLWLGIGGLLALLLPIQRSLAYDAILHAVFLGFAFAMIFGHAPIIFPAVSGFEVPMKNRYYLHLGLLHLSLALRVISDLARWSEGRRCGAMLNGIALLLFLLSTAAGVLQARREAGRKHAHPPLGTTAAGD